MAMIGSEYVPTRNNPDDLTNHRNNPSRVASRGTWQFGLEQTDARPKASLGNTVRRNPQSPLKPFDKPRQKESKVVKMTANEIALTHIISAIRGKDEQIRHSFFRNTLTPEETLVLAMKEARA